MAALLLHGTNSLTPQRSGWHRHLEGWQAGVVAVGIALGTALLVVPRGVTPRDVPLPSVDRAEERRAAREAENRAEAARKTPLPYLVRAVGEAVRRYGAAEARRSSEAVALRDELVSRFDEARKAHGDEPLLALLAVQTELFARAVERWARTGHPDAELLELGGSFEHHAETSGWARDGRLVLEPGATRCLYAVRFAHLVKRTDSRPFAPTLNQLRLYFRTLLGHPELAAEDARSPTTRRMAEDEARVRYVVALAGVDPEYPADLARGVLEYRLGHPASAADAFRAHLKGHPHGEFRLRAQNYLAQAASEARAQSEEEDLPD